MRLECRVSPLYYYYFISSSSIIMQRLTRHVSVIRMTNRRRSLSPQVFDLIQNSISFHVVQASLVECYYNRIITRFSIQTAGLAFGGTGLCSYRVRGVSGSCAEHLTVESYTIIISLQSYLLSYLFYWYSITHSLSHSMLKSFLFCYSSLPQPFLFLLQDSLYGFPILFTVTSEHIRLFTSQFFCFYTFLVVGSVRQIKLTYVGFREYVKIASSIVHTVVCQCDRKLPAQNTRQRKTRHDYALSPCAVHLVARFSLFPQPSVWRFIKCRGAFDRSPIK